MFLESARRRSYYKDWQFGKSSINLNQKGGKAMMNRDSSPSVVADILKDTPIKKFMYGGESSHAKKSISPYNAHLISSLANPLASRN
jgi:hypothetical protein